MLLTVQGTLLSDGGVELTVANCCDSHWAGIRFESTSAGRLHYTTITYGAGIRVLTPNFEAVHCHISHHNAVTATAGAIGLSGGKALISHCTSEANVGHLEPRQHQYCAEDRALPLFRKKTSNSTTYTTTAYPNPTQGTVSLKSSFGMQAVALYDLSERLLREWVPAGSPRETSLRFEGLTPGLYLLRASGPQGSTTTKLMVE